MGPASFSKVIIDCFRNHREISYPYPKFDVCFLHRITSEIIAGCASYDFESQKQSMYESLFLNVTALRQVDGAFKQLNSSLS